MPKASTAPSGVTDAADVEKIRRLGAVQLDDVHRRHRQARAVDQTADVAVEGDVVQVRLLGADVQRLFLRLICHRDDVVVAEQRVVVEVELGIDRQQLAVLGDHQRIDLGQRRIGLHERLGEIQPSSWRLRRPCLSLKPSLYASSRAW